MKKLFTEEEFQQANDRFIFKLECYHCGKYFQVTKSEILRSLKNPRSTLKYCSKKCVGLSKNKSQEVECLNCSKHFTKSYAEIQRSLNHFCSRSCSAIYNNKNKKYGIRRSKLEEIIEEYLTNLYPDLDIVYNNRSIIGSELDIYIDSLNIAFELNGIFHYEPIFGIDKLEKIQSNDSNKFKLCMDNKINLCVIDTSNQSHPTFFNSLKYLVIITDIIDKQLSIK